MKEYDVIIVGSGIAGMTAAIYLKRQNKNVLIIEKEVPGGQLLQIPLIENYPGITEINGTDLALNLCDQINKLEIPLIYENVTKITMDKVITTKNEYKSNYIVIATGRKPSKLGLENEDNLTGKGLSYCATCDGPLYKGEIVAAIGSGSSATTEALYLSNVCKKVYLICRKDKLKAEKILIDKVLKKDNIEIIYNSSITKLNSKNDKLHSIILNDKNELLIKGLFVFVGYEPNFKLSEDIKKINGYIKVNKSMQTNINNIYAIGDIIKKDVYQLTTAAAEATICAEHINNN